MDKSEGVVVMSKSEWNNKGCEKCRNGWFSGNRPPEIGVSEERWATLHKCEYCGTFWEAFLRNADITDIETIKKYYPDVYAKYFES
jgi:flavoprotein